MATEIELKLYCRPDEIARIESHPLIAGGSVQGVPKRLENTYFDTPDLALNARRVALRVRTTPTEKLQTVKCAADSVAGLSSRPEWEGPFTGEFSFGAVDNPEVQAFLQAQQAALVPVFTTSFERKTWKIDLSRKVSLWVMVDIGEVSSGNAVFPISEVELELAQGRPEDLLEFAMSLARDLPLLPNNVSKAERGYQLFLDKTPTPERAMPSALEPKQTSAAAFLLLARQGMQVWQANQLGIVTLESPGFVHQFRVALRRLGSLLKVFKPLLGDGFYQEWSARLKVLSRITGDVRNLDVMREALLQPILKSSDPLIRQTAAAAVAVCDKARQEAEAQVQHLRYGWPVLKFASALEALPTRDFPKNLPRFAENRLSALHRKTVKKLKRALASTTPDNAHQLRIALKHLRYSCEFFAPLFDREELSKYAKVIAGLQDDLGFVNDVHVTLTQLQGWIDDSRISSETRDCVAKWHAAEVTETLKQALPRAEILLGRCLPWCGECKRRGRSSARLLA